MPLVGHRWFLAAVVFEATISMTCYPLYAEFQSTNSQEKAGMAMSSFAKGMQITMPVKDEGITLGMVVVLVGSDGSIRIERESFLATISRLLNSPALKALKEKLPEKKYLEVQTISNAGLTSTYQQNDLTISIKPTVEQRPRGQITVVDQSRLSPSETEQPGVISGFLNTHFGIVHQQDEYANSSFHYPAMLFDGAIRWQDVVLEGEFEIEHDGTVDRRGTRLVYDLPQEAIRITAGDLALRSDGSFAMPPVLGMSVEKNYAALQPTRNIRPTGKRRFRIENYSEVDVFVNNHLVRSMRLSPGEYDLDSLPLTSGTNDIQLKVRDQFGKEEMLDFSVLFNRTLLAPGINEWSVSGGMQAAIGSTSPEYMPDHLMVGGVYRQGLAEYLTGGVTFQASEDTMLLGVNALTQIQYGLLSVDAAFSAQDNGALGWNLATHFDLAADKWDDVVDSLQIGVDITSADFVPGLEQLPNDGMAMRLSGSVGKRLPHNITANVSAFYELTDTEQAGGFGVTAALNRVVTQDMSLSVAGTYRELESGYGEDTNIQARLTYRPSRHSYIALERDGLRRQAKVSGGASFTEDASRTDVEVEFGQAPERRSGNLQKEAAVELHHANSRVEINASHGQQFEGLRRKISTRSSASLSTALAFVDGQFAWGRPVHGAYAIISKHTSLDKSTLNVDPGPNGFRAQSDGLGPLLVSDISAYLPTSVPYQLTDLPVGYDLGSSAFDFQAQYRSGYHVMVGSEFTITVVGTLVDRDGNPVSLKAGKASSPDHPEEIELFTNSSGRFAIQGLKPGVWSVRLNEKFPKEYKIELSEDTERLISIGKIKPIG